MKKNCSIIAGTENLKLDEDEIARRKAYLEFTEKDIALLVELHDRIEASGGCAFFVEGFYRHLLAFEETARLIADKKVLTRLKQTQADYFHSLTAGDYGPDYIHDRLRIGAAHQRVGLAPVWYIGAYNKYLSLLIPRIREFMGEDETKIINTITAVLKVMFLDMGLAIDTYFHAAQRTVRQKIAQLAALNQVAIAVVSTLSLEDILEEIMRRGVLLTASKASCIAFYDQASGRFKEWVTHGLSDHFVKNMTFRRGGLADEVFTVAKSYILSNDRPETKHKLSRLAHDEGIKSFICLPLSSRTHRLGVIYFYRTDRDTFTSDEIELLTTFAALAAGAIENARLHARTADQAATDALTGLPNRRILDQRLAEELRRARRYHKSLTLMLLDIDHFKQINDGYGHLAGDAVLETLAKLLSKQIRDVDFVARYGGEEFMFVLPETDRTGAELAAQRIRRAVAGTPFSLPDGREINVTVSIGIVCFPHCGGSARELTERADQALYSAKLAGRNRVEIYRGCSRSDQE